MVFLSAVYDTTACSLPQTFERALTDSDAIFLGTAVEEREVPMATKGGSNIGYKGVKFELTKSWKLVDKKTVWIRVPATIPSGCGYDSVGSDYLVYANQLNDILYISPMSRTMHFEIANEDIARLGAATIHISGGAYSPFKYTLTMALSILACFLLLGVWLLRMYRGPRDPNSGAHADKR
jgi:hypothetical protein